MQIITRNSIYSEFTYYISYRDCLCDPANREELLFPSKKEEIVILSSRVTSESLRFCKTSESDI